MTSTKLKVEKGFEAAPGGAYISQVVDVEFKMMKSNYAESGKELRAVLTFAFLADSEVSGDQDLFTATRIYNPVLKKKSHLFADVCILMGHEPKLDDEVDLEDLIGCHAMVQVVQQVKNDDTFANVASIMPAPKGFSPVDASSYVRQKDREEKP